MCENFYKRTTKERVLVGLKNVMVIIYQRNVFFLIIKYLTCFLASALLCFVCLSFF